MLPREDTKSAYPQIGGAELLSRDLLRFDDAATDCGKRCLSAVVDVETGKDHVDVPLHGAIGNIEFNRDLMITQALHDQSQNLHLARAERAARGFNFRLLSTASGRYCRPA
jgi:hypothetical protein